MQPIQEQPELELESEEEHKVRRWRLRQFLSLGFDLTTSAMMTDAPIDLGAARRLLALGCPRVTASQILL